MGNEKKQILKALGSKEVELGKCPYCNSGNYERQGEDWEGDYVKSECYCVDCEKVFTEYFSLDEVLFYDDEDDDSIYYNNSLSYEEKKIINELVKKEVGKGKYKEENLKRIINIMEGRLNKE